MTTRLTKNQIKFLNALTEHRGIISKAADQVGLHRTLHYKWMTSAKNTTVYKKEFEAIEEDCIDIVENALMDLIDSGDTAATIFYLKTKAKKRGYVERSEITGRDGSAIDVAIRVIEPEDE